MKKKIMEYTCDTCQDRELVVGDRYPYDKGWSYLFNFQFKTSDTVAEATTDKHFCSVRCFRDFIEAKIKDNMLKDDGKQLRLTDCFKSD